VGGVLIDLLFWVLSSWLLTPFPRFNVRIPEFGETILASPLARRRKADNIGQAWRADLEGLPVFFVVASPDAQHCAKTRQSKHGEATTRKRIRGHLRAFFSA